jgi:CRISPR-associated protein Cas6
MPENAATAASTDPEQVVDAVFAITCASLPIDHAWALSQGVEAVLPWFAEEPGAGLHTVHGGESGSGWLRPEGPEARIELSRRAKLTLRLPRHRARDAAALTGRTLDVAGSPLTVGSLTLRPLSRITTLFSRSVAYEEASDEPAFVAAALAELAALGLRPERMLCGREVAVSTPRAPGARAAS